MCEKRQCRNIEEEDYRCIHYKKACRHPDYNPDIDRAFPTDEELWESNGICCGAKDPEDIYEDFGIHLRCAKFAILDGASVEEATAYIHLKTDNYPSMFNGCFEDTMNAFDSWLKSKGINPL